MSDRRALLAVGTQFFVNGALFASSVPRLPEIRDQVGVDVATVGALLSLGAAAGLLGSAATSAVISRAGTRRVILLGGVLLAASLVVVGRATGPLVLLLGLAGMNVFDVLVDTGMNLQGAWISGRRPAPVMNRLHGLWSLGTLLGGVVAARLAASGVSLTAHLTGAAAVLLVLLLVIGRGLLTTDEHPSRGVPEDGSGPPPRRWWRRMVGSGLVTVFALGLLALAIESAPYDWAAFRLRDDLDAAPGVAALGFVGVTVGMTTGRFVGDHLLARFGRARLRAGALGVVGTGLVVAATVPVAPVVVVAFVLVGLGNATLLPGLYERAARWPGRPGAGMAALSAGLRSATLLVPAAVGALAATPLSVGAALGLVTVPCVAAFALLGREGATR